MNDPIVISNDAARRIVERAEKLTGGFYSHDEIGITRLFGDILSQIDNQASKVGQLEELVDDLERGHDDCGFCDTATSINVLSAKIDRITKHLRIGEVAA